MKKKNGIMTDALTWAGTYHCIGARFFFFKQKTAYEIVSGDWSSDVCSSDLLTRFMRFGTAQADAFDQSFGRENLFDDERSDEFDLVVLFGAVNHDFRSTEFFAAVNHINLAGVA